MNKRNGKRKTTAGFRALAKIDAARTAFRAEQLAEELPGCHGTEETVGPEPKRRRSAVAAIMEAAFAASLPPGTRRWLAHTQALAVVVQVPTSAWIEPTQKFFGHAFGERWVIVARDEAFRNTQKAGAASDATAADLARGRCVAGIATSTGMLPRSLVATADLTIKIEMPSPAVIRGAIRRFTGRSPARFAGDLGQGLDLDVITAAFRPGVGAQRIADRLAACKRGVDADAGDDKLPDLADAIEYGEAREWGLSLARDVADYRAGRIDWATSMPRGIVLTGEPGTGKSLYSRLVGKACGLPVVTTSVGEWFTKNSYLHDVIQAAQDVFTRAAAVAPAIVFLDEIDALPNRATVSNRNKDYWVPLINYLLTNLDNSVASTRKGVIVIGACNDASDLDPALLRPGRLEKVVEIRRPDFAGTLNIARHYAGGDLTEQDLAEFAAIAERSTGAEIMRMFRDGRRTARHAGHPVTIGDIVSAVLPAEAIAEDALLRISLHEAGHAAASIAIPWGQLRRCAVALGGGTAGHTLVEPDDGIAPIRRDVENRVTMLLAGRAAERTLLGSESLGDQGDLEAATRFIVTLHGSAGMGDEIVHLGRGDELLGVLRGDPSLRQSVERDLRRLEARADDLIRAHRGAVVAIARALREKRRLSGDAVRAIFEAARSGNPRGPAETA
jgi:cell division protease FtsH